MTKEEIVQGLYRGDNKAIKEAIKALEQQPIEDCVSRAEVLKQMKEWRDCEFVKMTNPYHYLEKRIQSMPPVTPTFPKGATNGDVIKAMFPQIKMREHNKFMFVVEGMAFNHESYSNLFFKDWWNAPYTEKRGNEE